MDTILFMVICLLGAGLNFFWSKKEFDKGNKKLFKMHNAFTWLFIGMLIGLIFI